MPRRRIGREESFAAKDRRSSLDDPLSLVDGREVERVLAFWRSADGGEAGWSGHRFRQAIHGDEARVGVDADTALVEKVAVTPDNLNDGCCARWPWGTIRGRSMPTAPIAAMSSHRSRTRGVARRELPPPLSDAARTKTPSRSSTLSIDPSGASAPRAPSGASEKVFGTETSAFEQAFSPALA